VSRDANTIDGFALRSINCIYEPGSTFKLVTDSYLLESGKVDPYDAFFGENGTCTFDFGTFHDDHEYGWLSFKESFVYSSNICTIKAALAAPPVEFYRHILRLGFGGRTGIDLPAESRGALREPRFWSARSLPSMAIGHEIGVTPLQMAMVYGALANGGELLAPRIALEERDARNSVVREFPIVRVRKVFSDRTAATMRDFCAEVVLKGTGKKAAVNGIAVAGKTGTSQKVVGGIYPEGKYVASFIGFAPARDPRIVCVVVLDEPVNPYIWGAESAAPLFGKIIEGINLSTDLFCDAAGANIAVDGKSGGSRRVPNFLRLTTDEAIDLASDRGLTVQCPDVKGVVFSQTPDPGTLIGRREEVKLMVRAATAESESSRTVPDVAGLSIREARRLLLSCGLDCAVRGFGIVERQDPPAGALLARLAKVMLICNPRGGEKPDRTVETANGALD
jgi:hypothetical protein